MPARRALLMLLLAGIAVGCGRSARRDPLRRQAVPASEPPPMFGSAQPFAPPTPPAPPPLPANPAREPDGYARVTSPQPDRLPDPAPAYQTPTAVAVQPPPQRKVPVAVVPLRERADLPTAVPASLTVAPPAANPQQTPEDRAKQLLAESKQRYESVNDFEARLVKREVVNGKSIPQDEVIYKFRKQPLSVSMKVLSEAGQGREVIFVKGRDDGAMHVVTGKGDNRLVGAGYKTTIDPDGRDATSKSRYRIYEAGFGRTLRGVETALQRGFTVRAVGPVQRPEYPYPMECVEVTATAAGDPSLPAGAKRSIFFDANPNSPSHLMPVLTEMRDSSGREIEYYCFDRLKLPAGLTDADFDPARMGRR